MTDTRETRDHPVSVAVDAAISRAESPDLNPTIVDREMALDRLEDVLTRALVVTLEGARLRLHDSTIKALRASAPEGVEVFSVDEFIDSVKGQIGEMNEDLGDLEG